MNDRSLTAEDLRILDSYKTLAEGLAAYLGASYEVTVHSLGDLNHSVIKIMNGFHTGRTEGSPITDLGISMLKKLEANDSDQDYQVYFSKNTLGEPMKSTTIASGAEAYPEGCVEAMEKNFKTIAVKAADIAIELGNAKCMNVVLFGAMCDSLGCPDIDWEQIVAETVPAKVKELNLKAFRAGREAAKAAK